MRLQQVNQTDASKVESAAGYAPAAVSVSPGHSRKGVVLVAVLVVLVLLTLAAYQFAESMIAEFRAADSFARSAQARALADSGINYTAVLLSSPETMADMLGGNPYDNPSVFANILVGPADLPRPGRFTVLAPPATSTTNGTQAVRYGVIDEAGKINLNALIKIDSSGGVARNMLMLLPHLVDKEEVVNAILDWIDADDEPRPNGAESDYYSALSPGYRCKNGPLDTLEELLLVRGVTPELLFGNDRNRNGILDPDEDDGSSGLDRGLSEYLTVYSKERNTDNEGTARIYINDSDLQGLLEKLTTALGEDLANYIIAYRMYSSASGSSGQGGSGSQPAGSSGGGSNTPSKSGTTPAPSSGGSGGTAGGGGSARLSRNQLNLQGGGRAQRISSLFDLVNSSITIPGSGQQQGTTYQSPLNDPSTLKQLLPLLLDKVTTSRDSDLPGRININTAPEAVLRALPGLEEAELQSILSFRPNPSAMQEADPIYQTPAWLMTEANVSPQTLRTLERYITARTQVYRAQVVGYFEGGGPAVRVEAVIDTNNGRPRILYWRDLTELGKGIDSRSLGNMSNVPR